MSIASEFRDELARLDEILRREVLRLRLGYQLTLDELRGVYVTDERVDDALCVTPSTRADGVAAQLEEISRHIDAMEVKVGARLGAIAEKFRLDAFEREVLFLAFAPELDLKYPIVYSYLNNQAARKQPTVDLALRLFGNTREHREKLQSCSSLFREGLVERVAEEPEARSELEAMFAIAPALSAALQGLTIFDRRLDGWVQSVAMADPARVLVTEDAKAVLSHAARALRREELPAVVVLEGDEQQAPHEAASFVIGTLGRAALRVSGHLVPNEPRVRSALKLVARLREDAVLLEIDERSTGAIDASLHPLCATLSNAAVPLVVSVPQGFHWKPLTRDLRVVRVVLPPPNAARRRALWLQALEREGIEARHSNAAAIADVADHFRLGPAQISSAVRALRDIDAADGSSPLADDGDVRARLFDAAKKQSTVELGRLAARVPQHHQWSDLVLPPILHRRLRDLANAIRARVRVFDEWGFSARGGCGLMALFAGASGTGKTMSAAVIAHDIGIDLYRVDLAGVISKYIGETEKNLHRIFEAAQSANAILFFDEADALLGKRSEVKDAHDRYANIEVAYLLQKMEEHDGVVILASNLAKNMDPAFARRMHFVIEFPRPDAALREQLWRRAFPSAVPIAKDVDCALLARRFELAGGDVKTIALDAAFAAAARGGCVEMSDLVSAATRQMLKQGKTTAGGEARIVHDSAGVSKMRDGGYEGFGVSTETSGSREPERSSG